MSLPTTPLLDNFQRADGGLGANWNDYSGDPLAILSQQVYQPGGGISPNSGASWIPGRGSNGTDQEAWMHMSAKSSSINQGLFLRWNQGSGNGYMVMFRGAANYISKIVNNVWTQLGAAFNLSNFASGAGFWGASVEATPVGGAVITAYFAPGNAVGVFAAQRVDPSPPPYDPTNAAIGILLDKNASVTRIDQFGGGPLTIKASEASGKGRIPEFDLHLLGNRAWL